jgi:hypothetical protein
MIHLKEALENLKAVSVTAKVNENGNLVIMNEYTNPSEFVKVEGNKVSFQIQDGVISENGVNGVQAVDIIRFSHELIKSLNAKYSCRENSITITKLEEAVNAQDSRTLDRIKRQVEGQNKA